MSEFRCCVIIPSYNRQAMLERVLEGLEQQTLPQDQFEVIVVLDGSTDGSAGMLAAWEKSGRIANLRWHMQSNSGQATARNTGAQLARSPIVLFLDDDIVPEPELIDVHLRWHEHGERIAVLGDCRMAASPDDSLYQRWVWAWWEDLYQQRARPGRQPGCRDFCAGNVSLRREDLFAVGGFDTEFHGYGGEDYELGYRLLQAGIRFVADRNAIAMHYHRVAARSVLRAARQEAHGDVRMSRKHPELMAGLRLIRTPPGSYGVLARLAMNLPAIGDRLAALGVHMLAVCERLRLHRRWVTLYYHLRGYAYWRGLRDLFPTWKQLREFQATAPALPKQTLEIGEGLPAELPPLWVDGPSQIAITYNGQELGTVELARSTDAPLHGYLTEQILNQLGPQVWLARLPKLQEWHSTTAQPTHKEYAR